MSRKTENIYKSLENLKVLQNQLSSINTTIDSKELQDIEFKLGQEINSLKFWISSLYLYNGKSTSNAKKASSRENGKKGGRPPKAVTELKKRKIELETVIIPDLETKKKGTVDFLEERCLTEEIEKFERELENIKEKLNSLKK